MQLTVNIYNDLELKCSQLMIDNDNVMFDNNFVVLLSLDFPAAEVCLVLFCFSDCRRSCTNPKDCGFATVVVGRVVYNARAEVLLVQLGHTKRPLR
jgi:hypothetical protein